MLSYRHGFHAGNHADLIKHLVLVNTLAYLVQKPKFVCYIDTHAGAGAYSLADPIAEKTGEWRQGIGRIWRSGDPPPAVRRYLDEVRRFGGDELQVYPGSPRLAAQILRPDDRLLLHEIHPAELPLLRDQFYGDSRVRVIGEDGFGGALAAMPPAERRGLVLIDPAYEVKTDHERVVTLVRKCHRRFATGVFALWYPVVERARIRRMEAALRESDIARIDLYELGVRPDDAPGMGASGMVVVNPVWGLRDRMAEALPWLARTLAGDDGFWRIEEIARE